MQSDNGTGSEWWVAGRQAMHIGGENVILGGCHSGGCLAQLHVLNAQISCCIFGCAMNKTFPMCKYFSSTLCGGTCCASTCYYSCKLHLHWHSDNMGGLVYIKGGAIEISNFSF